MLFRSLADRLRTPKQAKAAVRWYDRSLELLEALPGTARASREAVRCRLDAQAGRGRALLVDGRPEEAVAYCRKLLSSASGKDRAIIGSLLGEGCARMGVKSYQAAKIDEAERHLAEAIRHLTAAGDEKSADPHNKQYLIIVRILHARCLAQLGQHARAAAELAKSRSVVNEPTQLATIACSYALAAEAARNDTALPQAQRDQLAESYAVEAMLILKKVVQMGNTPAVDLRTFLRDDKDLACLRARKDFKELVASVEKGEKR